MNKKLLCCLTVVLLAGTFIPVAQADTIVEFDTSLGSFQVQLYDTVCPVTVANFLNYVAADAYDDSFFHRLVPGFVLQGGGYYWENGVGSIPTNEPIVNEFNYSNIRGTIAMAKLEDNPDSATSQFFFNLADNSANLDAQNGGFTVFGYVLGNGMDVVDQLAGVGVWNGGSPFDNIPLIDYPGTGDPSGYLEYIHDISVTPEPASLTLLGGIALPLLRRKRRK